MCLVALALDRSQRFPMVIATNRDEVFARPAARLAWWSPGPGLPDILGGRDLEGGGTWLGLTAAGRLALLTNVRDPSRIDARAPTRGSIVPLWLRGDLPSERYWPRVALSGHNGFNVIAADFRLGECFHGSSQSGHSTRLERGLYGLSNASLDTPWPKVEALKSRLASAVAEADDLLALRGALFEALADRAIPPDSALPSTGIPLDRERLLAPAFIRTPDERYGTRCSTLVITERVKRRFVTHVWERSFSVGSNLALMRHVVLEDWPPKYTSSDVAVAGQSPVLEEQSFRMTAGLDAGKQIGTDSAPNSDAPPAPRTRVRGVIKPDGARHRVPAKPLR